MTPQSPTPGQALTEAPVPINHPMLVAWTTYSEGAEYANSAKWAVNPDHTKGSMWAAFVSGWSAGTRAVSPHAPASDVAGGVEREAVARLLEPSAWVFYDKFLSDPRMKAEIAYETRPSLAKADEILALIRPAAPDAVRLVPVEALNDLIDAANSFCDDGDLLAGEVRNRVNALIASAPAPATDEDDASRDEARELAWSDFEGDHLTDGNGYAAADVYKRCRTAFDAAWPQGREAALAAALSAFRPAPATARGGDALRIAVARLKAAMAEPVDVRLTAHMDDLRTVLAALASQPQATGGAVEREVLERLEEVATDCERDINSYMMASSVAKEHARDLRTILAALQPGGER